MKRILPLILTVLLLPALLAVPARAEELGGGMIELLDYTTPNGTPGYTVQISPTQKTVNFALPYATDIAYIDVIFYTDCQSFTDLYSTNGLVNIPMQFRYVGGGLYHAFGAANYNNASMIALLFDGLDGAYDITFNRFTIYTAPMISDYLNVDIQVTSGSHSPVTYTYTGDPYWYEWAVGNENWSTQGNFEIKYILTDNWKAFDYVDIQTTLSVSDIGSIAVVCGGVNVPYTINQIYDTNSAGVPKYFVTLRLDLTGLVRSTDRPTVVINGISASMSQGSNQLWLHSCTGFLEETERNLLGYFFSQLGSWIQSQTTSLLSAISSGVNSITSGIAAGANNIITSIAAWGQNIVNGFTGVTNSIVTWGQNIVDAINGTGDASQVQDEINAAVDDLQQAGAALDAVDRPDIGKVNIDVAGMIDPDGLVGVAAIASVFTSNSLIYTIMVMFVTLALISYILFGKK